ncbi:MAG: ExbD/TolR family protein [Mangrovibacterium sp.]
MAEINTESKGSKKKGKPKKLSTRVDFTPMVDLGFLLITFFMLSTSMNKPQTMELSMPSKDKVAEEEQTKVKASTAVTILLGKEDKVYYYFGTGTEEADPEVKQTTYTPDGIRAVLLQRNQDVVMKIRQLKAQRANRQISEEEFKKQSTEIKSDKQAPVVLIKSTDEASYKNLVDILDEMQICNISRYAIVDITDYDKSLLAKVENPDSQVP